jgi:hypothetical protein
MQSSKGLTCNWNGNFNNRIKSIKFWSNEPTTPLYITVCWRAQDHARGDVNMDYEQTGDYYRYIPNSYFLNLLEKIRRPNDHVIIFSQNRIKSIKFWSNEPTTPLYITVCWRAQDHANIMSWTCDPYPPGYNFVYPQVSLGSEETLYTSIDTVVLLLSLIMIVSVVSRQLAATIHKPRWIWSTGPWHDVCVVLGSST